MKPSRANALNQLRLVTQYGNMTQAYKLVLARTLLDLARSGVQKVTLEDLALPYGRHLCRHMRVVPTQGSMRSVVLDACRYHNEGRIGDKELVDTILDRGFRYVLDAFPNARGDVPVDLYELASIEGNPGLVLRDNLLELGESVRVSEAVDEVEARWCLVEHSWHARRTGQDNRVAFDPEPEVLVAALTGSRRPIAHFRPALNSYHHDRCFYCGEAISLRNPDRPTHIDHFFPLVERGRSTNLDLDQVWNLVLTCPTCNLSKGPRLPAGRFLSRLHARNEALIGANHPLKETLVAVTGITGRQRRKFLIELERALSEGQADVRRWEPTT